MAQRPRFLNLARIHFPLAALVSIAHRLSGVLLFILVPVVLWSLQSSLHSAAFYLRLATWFSSPAASLMVVVALAGFIFHAAAGLRVIAFDAHWLKFKHARSTALWTILLSIGATSAVLFWVATQR